jgi:ring-1,2-phenylacetyl-CoA epoxidase subunit PaaE
MSQFHSLKISALHRDTREAVQITFEIPATLASEFIYQPGQHLTLRAHIDGEEVRRSYSICSAVQDDELRIAIKKVSDGVFSTWATSSLEAGSVIDVMPPTGNFHVPFDVTSQRRYLAVAAGSGITPIFSIIKSTLLAEPQSSFTLVYGNRASSTVMLRDDIANLKDQFLDRLSVIHVMSREKQDIDLFNGRIDAEKFSLLAEQWISLADVDHAFICGPHSMMIQISECLKSFGMPSDHIHRELFGVTGTQAARKRSVGELVSTDMCEVTVIVDGNHQTFSMSRDQQSVLDAGLEQGIDLRYACKGGICASCRCKLIEGQVDMDANYSLEDYEVARGFVLSCQAFPTTDKLVLDFDQDS